MNTNHKTEFQCQLGRTNIESTASELKTIECASSVVSDLQWTPHQQSAVLSLKSITQRNRLFISYRSQDPDLSLAKQIYKALKENGHEAFMAGESIRWGENWSERIDTELEQCDYFLLLLSPQSAASEMVIEEVRRAKKLRDSRSNRKPVILPIRVSFPQDLLLSYDLGGYLNRIQQREWQSPVDTPVVIQEILKLLAEGDTPKL